LFWWCVLSAEVTQQLAGIRSVKTLDVEGMSDAAQSNDKRDGLT